MKLKRMSEAFYAFACNLFGFLGNLNAGMVTDVAIFIHIARLLTDT